MRAPPCTVGKTMRRISIGELHVSSRPMVIQTLLGSCVSACLFDPAARVGGMNHIFLPGDPDLARYDKSARFGINAMEILINQIMSRGGERPRLCAKVFGGAQILQASPTETGTGRKNVSFVLSFLDKERIPILSRDVGGTHTRVLYFHTDSGEALLRRVPPARLTAVLEAERRLEQKVRREMDKDPEFNLFF